MNIFPGQGLGMGYTVLGLPLGFAYETTPGFTLCKLHGILLTPAGEPVGSASRGLDSSASRPTLVDSWNGVKVTAGVVTATDQSNTIIGTDKVSTTTNELGYFELDVVQGLTVIVTCAAFGKTITVDTTGETSIDLSTLI